MDCAHSIGAFDLPHTVYVYMGFLVSCTCMNARRRSCDSHTSLWSVSQLRLVYRCESVIKLLYLDMPWFIFKRAPSWALQRTSAKGVLLYTSKSRAAWIHTIAVNMKTLICQSSKTDRVATISDKWWATVCVTQCCIRGHLFWQGTLGTRGDCLRVVGWGGGGGVRQKITAPSPLEHMPNNTLSLYVDYTIFKWNQGNSRPFENGCRGGSLIATRNRAAKWVGGGGAWRRGGSCPIRHIVRKVRPPPLMVHDAIVWALLHILHLSSLFK